MLRTWAWDGTNICFPLERVATSPSSGPTRLIKESAHRTELERNVHAHLFRHGYTINFLNCSGRLNALQEQLGHGDINTTRICLRLSEEDVRREVQRYSSNCSCRAEYVIMANLKWLTIVEACKFLRISRRILYTYMESGALL